MALPASVALSRACGSGGFGTDYRYRKGDQLSGDVISVDYCSNAASLGALAVRARTIEDLTNALEKARAADRTSVIVIETDPKERVPDYDSWWDVPIAEVSEMESVGKARDAYDKARQKERYFL